LQYGLDPFIKVMLVIVDRNGWLIAPSFPMRFNSALVPSYRFTTGGSTGGMECLSSCTAVFKTLKSRISGGNYCQSLTDWHKEHVEVQ